MKPSWDNINYYFFTVWFRDKRTCVGNRSFTLLEMMWFWLWLNRLPSKLRGAFLWSQFMMNGRRIVLNFESIFDCDLKQLVETSKLFNMFLQHVKWQQRLPHNKNQSSYIFFNLSYVQIFSSSPFWCMKCSAKWQTLTMHFYLEEGVVIFEITNKPNHLRPQQFGYGFSSPGRNKTKSCPPLNTLIFSLPKANRNPTCLNACTRFCPLPLLDLGKSANPCMQNNIEMAMALLSFSVSKCCQSGASCTKPANLPVLERFGLDAEWSFWEHFYYSYFFYKIDYFSTTFNNLFYIIGELSS